MAASRSRRAQGALAYPQQRRDVEGFELWVDADSIAVAHEMREIHRLAVHEDELDLGMRNTDCFDGLLDGRSSRALVAKGVLAPLTREEIVELFVESKLGDRSHESPPNWQRIRSVTERTHESAMGSQESYLAFARSRTTPWSPCTTRAKAS